MPKVNYQYQKRQKELAKQRKKEQKKKLKELRKLEKEGVPQETETEGTDAPENPSASTEPQSKPKAQSHTKPQETPASPPAQQTEN